jgi:putative phage-type endonuclease
MKTLELVQGSPEWLAHRASHFNASDAPAMLGCSPYKTRPQLMHELHTGLTAEVDGATQRRFDDGHRFEALARPLAEQIVGEDLYPVVGIEGKYSASFDGLTMAEDVAFEHKSLNSQLKAALMSDAGADALPKAYRVQMEQQLMVSGAERVLFMASKWDGDTLVEELHDWYVPDAELRAEIIAGWKQFEQDLAAYSPPAPAAVEKIAAEPVEALPAPMVQVTGELTLKDNFKVFETAVRDFIEHRLIREPKTDLDFANLEVQIKAMKGARESLKANKAQMWAQVQPIDQANKTSEMLDDLLQVNLSMAERILKGEKESRKGEIVAGAVSALEAHIAALNARIGQPFMPKVPTDFGGATKGLKSLTSMETKVDAELNRARLDANAIADRIDINLKHLNAEAGDFLALFPDIATVAQKDPQDFIALVQFRVADARAKEEKRAEAQRERIAAEERAKAEAAVRAEQEAQRRAEAAAAASARAAEVVQQAAATPPPAPVAAPVATVAPERAAPPAAIVPAPAPAADAVPTLTLGQIGTRLGFPLTADFLRQLGFEPAGRARAALLFHEESFPAICEALVGHIYAALEAQPA